MDDTRILQDQNLNSISYDDIIKACGGENYPMSLTGDGEKQAVIDAVNQGIDSRLQACFIKGRDSYVESSRKTSTGLIITTTLECDISPESLPVLLRRLFESCDEEGESLASDILTTLGFDDYGKFVGREALGLD